MTFYNTTNEVGEKLEKSYLKTMKQDDIILLIFARNSHSIFTPFEIQDILNTSYDKKYPITSIRRSINTLTEREALKKTSIKRKGNYGKANYCWKYALLPEYQSLGDAVI